MLLFSYYIYLFIYLFWSELWPAVAQAALQFFNFLTLLKMLQFLIIVTQIIQFHDFFFFKTWLLF